MIILNVRFVGMSNRGWGVVEERVWGSPLVGKMMTMIATILAFGKLFECRGPRNA